MSFQEFLRDTARVAREATVLYFEPITCAYKRFRRLRTALSKPPS